MPRFNRITERIIGAIKGLRESLGISIEQYRLSDPNYRDYYERLATFEFGKEVEITQPIEFRTWESIAYYDPTANRYRKSETGLFLRGTEYRHLQSTWREQMVTAMVAYKRPELTVLERIGVVRTIELIRESDIDPDAKDEQIRELLGS